MSYVSLDFPPGVSANGTEYQNKGRWVDANLVRWQNGVMMPVGGWVRLNSRSSNLFSGVCRSLLPWRSNDGRRVLAVGTHTNLYIWSDRGLLQDVTPEGLVEGRINAVAGFGYGANNYGADTYGDIRPGDSALVSATTWSLDTFGEDLIACSFADGRVFRWNLNLVDDPLPIAEPVENAPERNAFAFVTQERHLVVLGAGGVPTRVAWSDRENPTEWTPTATNRAGDFDIKTNSPLISALEVRGQYLLFTVSDVYSMTFVGGNFVYGFELLGRNCGPGSANSAVAVSDFAVWLCPNGWHIYDGTVRQLPSEVEDYVFSDINLTQFSKVVGGSNAEFDEVWWLYPSANSTELNRYVAWNYVENTWTVGALPRTAFAPAGVFSDVIMADVSGRLFFHESGWTDNGQPLLNQRFAQAAPLEIGNGDRFAVVRRMVPDERTSGQTEVSFETRRFPNGAPTIQGPFSMAEQVPMRWTARQAAVRVESIADASWRVGVARLEVVEGARR